MAQEGPTERPIACYSAKLALPLVLPRPPERLASYQAAITSIAGSAFTVIVLYYQKRSVLLFAVICCI
jgi:hypothetical protein